MSNAQIHDVHLFQPPTQNAPPLFYFPFLFQFWIVPSILGSSVLYILSDNQWEAISAWIYGFGLSGLFIVSTTFHTISWKKRHLRLNLRELGPWASHMRWIIWIMASGGTLYVFFFHERYKPNTDGLVELVAGGIFYCFGTVFFKSDGRIPFAHAIWHLFVAFGAGTHYYAIWRYLYRPDGLQSHISR
ncbi:hypothetical protein E2320_012213 [Naja naja]|nr:hypothetical protein E2320_012213 [Naja naja]